MELVIPADLLIPKHHICTRNASKTPHMALREPWWFVREIRCLDRSGIESWRAAQIQVILSYLRKWLDAKDPKLSKLQFKSGKTVVVSLYHRSIGLDCLWMRDGWQKGAVIHVFLENNIRCSKMTQQSQFRMPEASTLLWCYKLLGNGQRK